MIFQSVEVIKTKDNYHFIEWEFAPSPGESIDDYKFQIEWSNDPDSGFLTVLDGSGDPVEIDGAVGPLTYTHPRKQFNFNNDYYYKIKAIYKPDELQTLTSDKVYIGNANDGVHEQIRYAEELLHKMYHGEPCKVIKRKTFGTRCPDCWNETRRQITKGHCEVCKGTGFVTGYYQPISIQISFDSDPKSSDVQKDFENTTDTKRARASHYPLLKPRDIIINGDDNKHYTITHIETTKLPNRATSKTIMSKQNYILSQILNLQEIATDDIEYYIDIDDIPAIPPEDDGGSGAIPRYNTHPAAIGEAPIAVDDEQVVSLMYDENQFNVVDGKLTLKGGQCVILTAAEVITASGKAISIDASGLGFITNNETLADIGRFVGVSLSATGTGGEFLTAISGPVSNDSWSFDPGKTVYYNSNGDIDQQFPVTGIFQPIGTARSSTEFFLDIKDPVQRAQ